MDVATRDLKDHLSEYLKRVQAGEELTITSHGKPIAKLSPPDKAPQERSDPLANVSWIRPVSYTHLDVYKRQANGTANAYCWGVYSAGSNTSTDFRNASKGQVALTFNKTF